MFKIFILEQQYAFTSHLKFLASLCVYVACLFKRFNLVKSRPHSGQKYFFLLCLVVACSLHRECVGNSSPHWRHVYGALWWRSLWANNFSKRNTSLLSWNANGMCNFLLCIKTTHIDVNWLTQLIFPAVQRTRASPPDFSFLTCSSFQPHPKQSWHKILS